MQDLKSMHGIDIEKEMVKALAAEISADITEEHLQNLRQIAVKEEKPLPKDGNLVMVYVNAICNDIAKMSKRGAGNKVIVSQDIWDMIQPELVERRSFDFCEFNERKFPLEKKGTVYGGRITIYTDRNAPDQTILAAYKGGSSETDAGYFFLPYIMLMTSGVVVDPFTFQPQVNLMTRYGRVVDDNSKNYYKELTFV